MGLRILHIINNLPIGGAEKFLIQLAPQQQRNGCEVAVLSLVEPNPLAAELVDVSFKCLTASRLNDPRLWLTVIRAIRSWRPDIVHTHLFYGDIFGGVAARLAGVAGIVSTEHSTEPGDLSWRRNLGMLVSSMFHHHRVAVSSAVRNRAAQRLHLERRSVSIVPNGIRLGTSSNSGPISRTELEVDENAFIVTCVGRIVDSKGYATLLKAFKAWNCADAVLLMLGDGPARLSLEDQAKQMGLTKVVKWLGFRDDVPRVLAATDVFAMPSFFEGHSIALLEAMNAGCCCLVSDIDEFRETLGEAGFYVQAGNEQSICRGLKALHADESMRSSLSCSAKRRVKKYSIESAAARYIEIYHEVLQAKDKPLVDAKC